MATESLSTWGAAIRGAGVQFAEFMSQNVAAYTPSWDPVVKTRRSDKPIDTFSGKTGIGYLTRFTDGGTVPSGNRYKLYDTTFSHSPYGNQVELTRYTLMGRDWNAEFDEFKDFAISAKATLSRAAAQIFNNGFSTGTLKNGVSVTTYNDGKALCSTAHPRVDGGAAQSNASSTGITLSESNFETARIAIMEQLQDDGTLLTVTGDLYLVVPRTLEKVSLIFTGSELRPGTADNDVNIYSGGAYKVLVSTQLDAIAGGSDTAWFVVAASGSKLILNIWHDAEMDKIVNFNTGSMMFKVIADFSVGSYDWHYVWGSKGDGLSYTG